MIKMEFFSCMVSVFFQVASRRNVLKYKTEWNVPKKGIEPPQDRFGTLAWPLSLRFKPDTNMTSVMWEAFMWKSQEAAIPLILPPQTLRAGSKRRQRSEIEGACGATEKKEILYVPFLPFRRVRRIQTKTLCYCFYRIDSLLLKEEKKETSPTLNSPTIVSCSSSLDLALPR